MPYWHCLMVYRRSRLHRPEHFVGSSRSASAISRRAADISVRQLNKRVDSRPVNNAHIAHFWGAIAALGMCPTDDLVDDLREGVATR